MKNILFVCTGNTCRSPMAEGFVKAALAKNPGLSSGYDASSAGISPYEGDRASSNSIEVMMTEWKIDISNHTATALNINKANQAFIILTMTKHQKELVTAAYPEAIRKTFTLKEYAYNSQICTDIKPSENCFDITDPYGGPLPIYSLCAGEIKRAVDGLLQKILT